MAIPNEAAVVLLELRAFFINDWVASHSTANSIHVCDMCNIERFW